MRSACSSAIVLTVVLIAGAPTGFMFADAGPDHPQAVRSPEDDSGRTSRGGVFSVTARAAIVGDVSSGAGYRLVGSSRTKVEPGLFSDGFESGDTSTWSTTVPEVQFPSRAIVAFELEACPAGWVEENAAQRGRAVVGVVPGGQVYAGTGSGWTGENDAHFHYPDFTVPTDSDSGHSHHWSTLVNASIKTWQSFDAAGNNVNIIQWNDGLGNEGSGFYPLTAPPGSSLYTNNAFHTHQLHSDFLVGSNQQEPLPTFHLRFCKKE